MEKFISNIDHTSKPIKEWRRDPNKHKHVEKGMYAVDSLTGPYYQIDAMICRLFAYPNTKKVFDQWNPLIDVTSEGYTLDWGKYRLIT